MNIKKELGEKIKRLRKKRNLTQEQLAEIVDIAPRNLSGIEVGAYFVKADTLEKILNALEVTSEELFANEHLLPEEKLVSETIDYIKSIENDKAKLERIYKVVKLLASE